MPPRKPRPRSAPWRRRPPASSFRCRAIWRKTSSRSDARRAAATIVRLTMQTAVARFLRFLAVERNASPLTTKSYREDLTALVDYLTEAYGRPPTPGEITTLDLRGYVSA